MKKVIVALSMLVMCLVVQAQERTDKKHNKTIVQIILRWHIQEGFSVIPGNTNPEWIKENISIFDFRLDEEDMKTMRSLNQEKRFYNMSLEQLEKFVFARQIRK